MDQIEEISAATTREAFEREVAPSYRPVVMRGVAREWPLVAAGREDVGEALSYLERLDSGVPTDVMLAPPQERGRFFYAPDMRGFNFQRRQGTIAQVAAHLRELAMQDEPMGVYAGAAEAAVHTPGLEEANPFLFAGTATGATTRVWLGNATQVSTHFDLSDNFAVVALGQRRFTLFPPDTVGDLYVGPLDVTLAGQPVSMVDPLAPDMETYPRFEHALERASFAELEPGDAIYIPTLWWHHVAARDPVNILVNYWHNDTPHGGGFVALVHAILAIRDRPEPQREAWRAWFEHMVFAADAPASADHIPLHARGVTGSPSPERDSRIRRFIASILTGGS
ncbi:cupin-like domain-containing protein [Erythrobacter sp. LQ02-29]|uniref:cupin-like domain-containing protein n=1 Tax=Erythrobacter sp. LQ02-29 TaxID=2920384 RepID=UPI001F4EF002|nr:cupin-like domain-containing protein [Erythrobacter sp. LQ02-29]MCP9223533.1 cupin-like domain-containing protein [Erythrobacter sp. LQ02-29]